MKGDALPTAKPIRRSALEVAHATLGARWQGDEARWPADYNDPSAELAAAAAGIGLAEIGPLDKVLVRGRGALDAGGIMSRYTAWPLAPDVVLVVAPALPGAAGAEGGVLEPLIRDLRDRGLTAVDVGSGLAVLRLAGPSARDLLAELCAVDVSERAMPPETIVQAPLAGVMTIVVRADAAVGSGFTLLVPRDAARYIWDVFLELGAVYGIRPVGSVAVAPITVDAVQTAAARLVAEIR